MKYIHFGRAMRQYKDISRFYSEIFKYGKNNFNHEVLEECDREELLSREQYYYDLLQPSYNQIRPCECPFTDEVVKKKSKLAQQTQKYKDKMKIIHEGKEFRLKCKNIHTTGKQKMKPVDMMKDNIIELKFDSISEAGNYIKNNTDYSAHSSKTKIKEVCDGKRKSAYGFNWKYSNV